MIIFSIAHGQNHYLIKLYTAINRENAKQLKYHTANKCKQEMQTKQTIDNLFQDTKKRKKKLKAHIKKNKSLLTIDKPVNNSFKKIVQLPITEIRNKVDKTNTQTIGVQASYKQCAIGNNPDLNKQTSNNNRTTIEAKQGRDPSFSVPQ